MTKTLVLDADDTICNFRHGAMIALNTETGKNIHWKSWDTYNLQNVYDMPREKFLDILIQHKVIETIEPHLEAKEIMQLAKDNGYRIVILTARGWHPNAKQITESWLVQHSLPFDEAVVTSLEDCKAEVLRKLGKVHIAVDDNAKHCTAFSNCDNIEHAFLYDQPWNVSACDKLTRIDTLHGIKGAITREN